MERHKVLAENFKESSTTEPAEESESLFDGARFLVGHLNLIDRLIATATARISWSREERDDFRSCFLLKLIQNDYAALRSFQGRSKLSTFLHSAIQRAMMDYQNKLWGKWRPSAAACRAGGLGIAYDRLVSRDGLSIQDALETLSASWPGAPSPDQLAQLLGNIPPRPRRRQVEFGQEGERLPTGTSPEVRLQNRRTAGIVTNRLRKALQKLSGEDRALIRARLVEGRTLRSLALEQQLDTRVLYSRYEKIKRTLRQSVCRSEGIDSTTGQSIEEWFSETDLDLSELLPGTSKNGRTARS